jgi:hypothetical protein
MSTTTVGQLIEALQELVRQHGDECPVMFAHQPGWPLEVPITEQPVAFCDEWEEDGREVVIYIAASTSGEHGYLPGTVAEQLGWK